MQECGGWILLVGFWVAVVVVVVVAGVLLDDGRGERRRMAVQ